MLQAGQSLAHVDAGNETRYELTASKPSVVWNFTRAQLRAEITRLERQLQEKRDLLVECNALDIAKE